MGVLLAVHVADVSEDTHVIVELEPIFIVVGDTLIVTFGALGIMRMGAVSNGLPAAFVQVILKL